MTLEDANSSMRDDFPNVRTSAVPDNCHIVTVGGKRGRPHIPDAAVEIIYVVGSYICGAFETLHVASGDLPDANDAILMCCEHVATIGTKSERYNASMGTD
jgi:hypothetical protein